MMAVQIFGYPRVDRWIGSLSVFRWSLIFWLAIAALPFSSLLADERVRIGRLSSPFPPPPPSLPPSLISIAAHSRKRHSFHHLFAFLSASQWRITQITPLFCLDLLVSLCLVWICSVSLCLVSIVCTSFQLLVWGLTTALHTVIMCAGTCAMAAVNLLINNSAYPHAIGTVNGIAASGGAFPRLFAPLIGGMGFAWSIHSHWPFPFDYPIMFLQLGVVSLLTLACTVWLTSAINHRRAAPTEA